MYNIYMYKKRANIPLIYKCGNQSLSTVDWITEIRQNLLKQTRWVKLNYQLHSHINQTNDKFWNQMLITTRKGPMTRIKTKAIIDRGSNFISVGCSNSKLSGRLPEPVISIWDDNLLYQIQILTLQGERTTCNSFLLDIPSFYFRSFSLR